jgi:hypothetical protein
VGDDGGTADALLARMLPALRGVDPALLAAVSEAAAES